MAKQILQVLERSTAFWVCLIISIVLVVSGFVVPPTGVIDGSVLKAVGELFAFATLWVVYKAIQKGIDAKLTHGNTSVTIGDLNNDSDIKQIEEGEEECEN